MRPRNIISPASVILLAEIAATGFEDFVKALDKGAARAPSPVEKLKAMGQSYVAFARERPAVYQLMFGVAAPLSSERLQAAKMAAWEQLANAVSAAAGPEDKEAKAMQVWSTVHGFSMLVISQRLPPISQYFPGAQAGDRRVGPCNRGQTLNIN